MPIDDMLMSGNASRFIRLAYWLGPWAPQQRKPGKIGYRAVSISEEDQGASRLYVPTGREIRGAWLISPGLQYNGPADARIDRLSTILAASGYAVLSPAIRDLIQSRIRPTVIDDLRSAFDVLVQQPEVPKDTLPRLFAVSVGSVAALRLASSPTYAHRISRLVTFGAYADPGELMRSLLCGSQCRTPVAPKDPLNQPVAFLTLIDDLPVQIHDAAALCEMWRHYIRMTWPRNELKSPDSTGHIAVARSLTPLLCSNDRELFLIGCGALPGGYELCRAALESGHYDYLDPRPYLRNVRAPTDLIHGIVDSVVSYSQLEILAAEIPGAHVHPLQLQLHSSALSLGQIARKIGLLPGEAKTFMRIVSALI